MEERFEEGMIKGAINSITLERVENILKQMKNCICKITGKNIGTGFFCKIPYKKEIIPVLITNYHIIDDNFIENTKQIKISINGKSYLININNNGKIYSSVKNEYDLMIIKLKEDIIKNYLELDENLFTENSEKLYTNESIYILHYPNGDKASVSFGYGIEKIKKYDIKHLCNTEPCSSGGPILNLQTNKVIGTHKGFIKAVDKIFNIGSFLKFPLDELNVENDNKSLKAKTVILKNSNEYYNEIKILIEIKQKDINKKIYFLDNTNNYKDKFGIIHNHDYLKELNSSNTDLYINGIKTKYQKYIKSTDVGKYSINLKFNISITDSSYMF